MQNQSTSINPSTFTVIITGDEILSGKRQDNHLSFITGQLTALGLKCTHCFIAGDNDSDLSSIIKNAIKQTPIVIITGGLGPTLDDITRDAISHATGIPLAEHPDALHELEQRFKSIGRPMSNNNLLQALVPDKGTFLSNPNGTAPGLVFNLEDKVIIALPGPPRELKPMVIGKLIPFLQNRFDLSQVNLSTKLSFCCAGESNIDRVVRKALPADSKINVSSLSHPGNVDLTLSIIHETNADKIELENCIDQVKNELGEFIYSEENRTLPETVGLLLRERNETLAVAESCTGGQLGAQFTSVPGSSTFFYGGAIVYCNLIKEKILGIDNNILEKHGAVSRETAEKMAEGVISQFGSTWGIAITGIAGPGGGTPEKPVGTVWISIGRNKGKIHSVKFKFFGNRESVRNQTCIYAMDQLRRIMLDLKIHE